MELTNDFRVSVPPAQAWKVFTDVERIAPLLPGAQLQEIEGDEFRGIVKVKVGPIQAQYKGVATFLEQDESSGRVVLKANGRDTRGQGNANATITATMTGDGDGTKVSVVTELTVTGKVAQFGRGVLADVSGKLIRQFVEALEADLENGGSSKPAPASRDAGPGDAVPGSSSPTPSVEEAGPTAAGEALVSEDAEAAAVTDGPTGTEGLEAVTAGGVVGGGTTAAPAAEVPAAGPRRIDSPDPDPVDLLDAAGGSVAKRAIPAAGAMAALVLFVVLRRRAKARRRAADRMRALPVHLDVPSLADVRDQLPSWSDVRDRLPEIPDAGELRKLSRKAAKDARKQAARTGAVAAIQVGHARDAGLQVAAKLSRKQVKAARKSAKRARKVGTALVGHAQGALEGVAGRS